MFIIGNAEFRLTRSVLFCLPQVNECSVLLFFLNKKYLIDIHIGIYVEYLVNLIYKLQDFIKNFKIYYAF